MAAVTYDGVESAEGGNIFKDVKFWVATRVPTRKSILEMVTNNGGTVVPLEKNADILIADHARKDVPAGSYSWKFITESVENGIIQIKDRYRIGRDPDLPRPAGGGVRGTKSTRTPFTIDDDAGLAKWVLAHTVDRTGNKIFQEFESINPRHTWQSWRNRFVKTLQLLPIDQLQKIAASAPEEESNSAEDQAEATATVPTQPQETVKEIPHRSVEKSSAPRSETAQPAEPILEPIQTENDTHHDDEQDPDLSDTEDSTLKHEFYKDLSQFVSADGLEIKLRHTIDNKIIELWDLANAVSEKLRGPLEDLEEEDWAEIAMDMGFQADETTIAQLQQCFDENLADFLDAVGSFDGVEDEDEDEFREHDPSPLLARAYNALEEPDFEDLSEQHWPEAPLSHDVPEELPPSYVRSSPPVGAKRSLGQRPLSSSGPLTKRPRYNTKLEIPSTPDIEVAAGRKVPSAQYFSPSIRKSLSRQDYVDASETSRQLSPFHVAQKDHPLEEDGDEGEIQMLEVLKSRVVQPQSPLLDTQGTFINDTTPSQQLRTEALNSSPIPFRLSKTRQTKKTGLERSGSQTKQKSTAGSNQHQEGNSKELSIPTEEPPSTAKKELKPAPRRSLPPSFNSNSRPKAPAAPTPAPAPAPAPTKAPRPRPLPSDSKPRNIDEWIKHYESTGFPRSIVIEGLKRTTLTPGGLASLVMQSLQDGNDVPSHHEGIWTDRDDTDLKLIASVDLSREPSGPVDERRYRHVRNASKRLAKKHGPARVELRKSFLDAQAPDKP
ncbi:TRF2-interacting telomeric protein/Rap1 C terminal domain-containing protein [Ilyonectria destructans]|nr:TRF2-interacting telomeric protein/Rap1 C terminal domain-containing protein [Ilyonectria destructans]